MDILIKNGLVIDGSGEKGKFVNVGIEAGKIVYLGQEENEAVKVIDAKGLMVVPGFVDSHSHTDVSMFTSTHGHNMLLQGVTTEIVGNCGSSAFPAGEAYMMLARSVLDETTVQMIKDEMKDLNAIRQYMKTKDLGTNLAFLIGHGNVREAVMGFDSKIPSQEDMEKMKSIVELAMQQGAIGLSTGLLYPPGVYALEDELVELCKVVAKYNGVYASHIRNEGDELIESIEEAIRIGERAKVRVNISHIKVAGSNNWGKSVQVLALIEAANAKGIQVTADQYPYKAGATTLISALPPKFAVDGLANYVEKLKDQKIRGEIVDILEQDKNDFQNIVRGCGFDGIMIIGSPSHPEYLGKSIQEISEIVIKDPYDTIFDLIIEDEGLTLSAFFMMCDDDIDKFIASPMIVVGSDGAQTSDEFPAIHPRYTGTFVKVLSEHVRDKKVVELEKLIYKMSYLPAKQFKLKSKGLIKEGYDADLVIFDQDELKTNANFINPNGKNEGLAYVMVGGQLAVVEDQVTGNYNGCIL